MPLRLLTSAARGRPTIVLQEDGRSRFEGGSDQDMSFMLAMMNMMSQQGLAAGQLGLQRDIADVQKQAAERTFKAEDIAEAKVDVNETVNRGGVEKTAQLSARRRKSERAVLDGSTNSRTESLVKRIVRLGEESVLANRDQTKRTLNAIKDQVGTLWDEAPNDSHRVGMAKAVMGGFGQFLELSQDAGEEGAVELLRQMVTFGPLSIVGKAAGTNVGAEHTLMEDEDQAQLAEQGRRVAAEAQGEFSVLETETGEISPAALREARAKVEKAVAAIPLPSERRFTTFREGGSVPRGEFVARKREVPGVIPAGVSAVGRGVKKVTDPRWLLGEGGGMALQLLPQFLSQNLGMGRGGPSAPGGGPIGPSPRAPSGSPGFIPGFRGSPMPFPAGGRVLAEEVSETGGPNRPMTDEEFNRIINEGEFKQMDDFIRAFP